MTVKINKGAAIATLSLTPLIDIVFLLLIFFLVTTRFADEDRAMDVDLPTASEAQPMVVKPKEIFVNIDKEGLLYLGGHEKTLAEVEDVLRAAAANNPGKQSAIIRADKWSPLNATVQVMNMCKKVGVEHRLTTKGDVD